MAEAAEALGSMKKYIIFDFDGTLINTDEIIIESWDATFKHYGHRVSREEIFSTFGETLVYTISQRMPEVDSDEAIQYYKDYQAAHCEDLVTLFEPTMEILDGLRARGCKMAIATSRLEDSFTRYMNQFGLWDYFETWLTKDDVTKHKPDPESCLVALKRLGGTPEEALMIGDTRFDIGCANNAGVDSVLAGWSPNVSRERIVSQGYVPKYFPRTAEELFKIVDAG